MQIWIRPRNVAGPWPDSRIGPPRSRPATAVRDQGNRRPVAPREAPTILSREVALAASSRSRRIHLGRRRRSRGPDLAKAPSGVRQMPRKKKTTTAVDLDLTPAEGTAATDV